MSTEANSVKNIKAIASEKYEALQIRSRNLGEIMRNHPEFQSNSPELYLLAYLKELGSKEV